MSAVAAPAASLLEWDSVEQRLIHAGSIDGEPDVVDSWLVEDGRTRAIGLHTARFMVACRSRHDLSTGTTAAFLACAMRAVPPVGRWFPRVELIADAVLPRLVLRLRTAPARSPTVRVRIHEGVDPRRAPQVKGPDLMAMHAARARAGRAGAGEALLLGPDGRVREGAFSAIMWWRGDALCTTAHDAPVLNSVTKALLLQMAASTGHLVRFEAVTPADLDGLEVWAVSALHGIRAVTALVGTADVWPAAAVRAEQWNIRLDQAVRPLPS